MDLIVPSWITSEEVTLFKNDRARQTVFVYVSGGWSPSHLMSASNFRNFLEHKNEILEKSKELQLLYQEHSRIEFQFNHTIIPPGIYILGISAQCMTTGTFHSDTFVFRQFENIVEKVEEAITTFVVYFIPRTHHS